MTWIVRQDRTQRNQEKMKLKKWSNYNSNEFMKIKSLSAIDMKDDVLQAWSLSDAKWLRYLCLVRAMSKGAKATDRRGELAVVTNMN